MVGETIKTEREKRGLSQAALTKLIEEMTGEPFGANTLRRIEKGQTNPRPATLEKITNALGMQMSDVVEVRYTFGCMGCGAKTEAKEPPVYVSINCRYGNTLREYGYVLCMNCYGKLVKSINRAFE